MSDTLAPHIFSSDELSVDEMAELLKTSSADVLAREQAGKLFSFVRPKISDAKRFPLYQLAREITPELLQQVREQLDGDGALLYQFFSCRDPDLGGLCVRELLCGQAFPSSEVDQEIAWVLGRPFEERIQCALVAAQRLRETIHSWG